jgi:hypothetical protein
MKFTLQKLYGHQGLVNRYGISNFMVIKAWLIATEYLTLWSLRLG